jgi:predicted GTPase
MRLSYGAGLVAAQAAGGVVVALRATLERVGADVVVAATPVDLARLIAVSKPIVRARYEFAETGEPTLGGLVG